MGLCLSMPASSESEISEEVQSYIKKAFREYFECDTSEKALEYLDEAIKLDPNCLIAHVLRADELSHLNRLSEATQACEIALSIKPNDLFAKYMHARIKNKEYNIAHKQDLSTNSKEYVALLKQITKAKAITSYDYQAKGWAYEKLGDIESQVRMFVKSLQKEPDVYTAFQVGKIYFAKGEYQLAIHGFNIAVEEDPECFWAWGKLITSYERAGQNEKALEIALKVVELFPDNATAYHWVAVTYANFGEVEKREGNVAHARELYDESIKYYEKVLPLLPNCPLYHCTLAQTYYDRALEGDDIRAMESFNLAFELYKDPKNREGLESVHENIQRVFSTQRAELLKKLTVLNEVKLELPNDSDDPEVQALKKKVDEAKAEVKTINDEVVEILDIKSEATEDAVTLKASDVMALLATVKALERKVAELEAKAVTKDQVSHAISVNDSKEVYKANLAKITKDASANSYYEGFRHEMNGAWTQANLVLRGFTAGDSSKGQKVASILSFAASFIPFGGEAVSKTIDVISSSVSANQQKKAADKLVKIAPDSNACGELVLHLAMRMTLDEGKWKAIHDDTALKKTEGFWKGFKSKFGDVEKDLYNKAAAEGKKDACFLVKQIIKGKLEVGPKETFEERCCKALLGMTEEDNAELLQDVTLVGADSAVEVFGFDDAA